MFKNSYQNGLLSIFYSCGANPLAIWDMEVHNGHVKRVTDTEVNSIVLEIVSTNVATTYISCPRNKQCLGIKLPFLVMIVKNLKRYFSFEITILDDKNLRRRFRISNFQSTTKIKPFCTSMPIGLSGGWNQIQFNLSDFTRRAYGTQYIESLRVQVHANVRLRRIYFAERLYTEEELPQDYKLYLPLERKQKKGKDKKEEVKLSGAAPIPPPPAKTDTPIPEGGLAPEVISKKSTVTVTPVSEAEAEKPPEGEPPTATEGETPAEADTPAAETAGEEVAEAPEGTTEAGESEATAEAGESEATTEGTAEPPEEAPAEK